MPYVSFIPFVPSHNHLGPSRKQRLGSIATKHCDMMHLPAAWVAQPTCGKGDWQAEVGKRKFRPNHKNQNRKNRTLCIFIDKRKCRTRRKNGIKGGQTDRSQDLVKTKSWLFFTRLRKIFTRPYLFFWGESTQLPPENLLFPHEIWHIFFSHIITPWVPTRYNGGQNGAEIATLSLACEYAKIGAKNRGKTEHILLAGRVRQVDTGCVICNFNASIGPELSASMNFKQMEWKMWFSSVILLFFL